MTELPDLAVDGFDAFHQREYRGLLRLALGLVDRRDRAEELVQGALERTLMRWERLENPGGFARTAPINSARSELWRRSVTRRWRAGWASHQAHISMDVHQ